MAASTVIPAKRCGRPEKPPEERLVPITVRLAAFQVDEICRRALKSGRSAGKVLGELLAGIEGFRTQKPGKSLKS